MRQSKTTLKELTAQYRSVLKRAFIAGVMAVATANSANAAITPSDIRAINDSINMLQSDGNYTTSKGDFNAGTTDYSTAAGYGLYTYDHDNNPETDEIALTTKDGTETLDNTVFTYTDNTGGTTNLGVNATGFTTGDFTDAAGTISAADGTTDLTTLEAKTTTVGLGNYQYMANFDNSGYALTALTADAPELSSFHNDITLTTGTITVNGNNEANKPSIDQYGFTITLHDGSTGNFDLVYNESTHLYSYNYNGDVVLDATDIAAADAQVTTQSNNLINDTGLFNGAVATNTNNYNSTLGHYNNVHNVYESDANAQTALNDRYDTYKDTFETAKQNKKTANENLLAAQGAYATDLAIYTPVATAYNNYKYSLGKSIDAKDETVLTSANAYADSLASNYDAAGAADAAETNAKDYADSLASNYDAAGSADAEQTRAVAAENALQNNITAEANARADADTTLQNNINAEADARADADTTLQNNIDNEVARATAQEAAIRGEFAAADAATLNQANAYTDAKVDTLEKNVSGGIAAATALSAVEVSNVKRGEMSVGGGYGYYNGQSAGAFGMAMGLSDNWSVNAGAGIASGDKTQVAFRAGTNYKFKLF